MPRRARHAARTLVAAWLLGTGMAPVRADMVFIAPTSYAAFSVRVFWLKHVRGQFENLYGNIDWSPQRRQGVVHAWIDVASARMRRTRERRMLLGPGFLDAARYPRISFVSVPIGLSMLHSGGMLRGQLSMHGVTRPVTFTLQPAFCPQPETTPCTLRLHGSVRRSHFGITHHGTIVSDRVRLDLVIRLAPQ